MITPSATYPELAKVAFDAGVRDAKETTLSDFTSTNTMEYNGQTTEANGSPEKPLNYHESQTALHDAERSKSSLEGAGSLVDIINDISKVTNADEAIQIIKGADISKWAETDIYELISDSFKKADWSEADIGKLQHSIAKESGWIGKYYDENMNVIWTGMNGDPNIDGFVNGFSELELLEVGAKIDRYGHPGGGFLSPEGTSYGARALKPGTKETSNYFVYEVLKPIEVSAGEIAPWFGQMGGGIQYYLGKGKSVQQFIDEGFLKVVKEVIN